MKNSIISTFALAFLLLIASACGGGAEEASTPSQEGLSQEEIENGIGPIKSVSLGTIDAALAETGAELFRVKCSACHKMAERYVGPPLGDVTETRSAAFVMNMILNPEGMIAEHPEVRDLLAKYMTPMPNQQLSEDDARAVLEYLRTQAAQ